MTSSSLFPVVKLSFLVGSWKSAGQEFFAASILPSFASREEDEEDEEEEEEEEAETWWKIPLTPDFHYNVKCFTQISQTKLAPKKRRNKRNRHVN